MSPPDAAAARDPRGAGSRARRFFKGAVVVGAVIVFLAVGLIAGGIAYLSTDAGATRVAAFAVDAVRDAQLGRLELDEFDIELPATLRAARVTITGDNGPWLQIANPEVRLGLAALAAGNLRFERLFATALELGGIPQSTDDTESDFPRAYILDELVVEQLSIDERLIGLTSDAAIAQPRYVGPIKLDAAIVVRPGSGAFYVDGAIEFAAIETSGDDGQAWVVGPGSLRIDVAGRPSAVSGSATLVVQRARFGDTQFEDANVRLHLEPKRVGTVVAVEADGALSGLPEPLQFLFAERLTAAGRALIGGDGQPIGDVTVEIDGGAGLRVRSELRRESDDGWAGRVTMEGEEVRWPDSAGQLTEPLGPRFKFVADVALHPGKSVAAPKFDLDFGPLTASGDAGYLLEDGALFADVEGVFDDLNLLAEVAGRDLEGRLDFTVVASGTSEAAVVAVTARTDDLKLENTTLDAVEIAANITGLPRGPIVALTTTKIGNATTTLDGVVRIDVANDRTMTFEGDAKQGSDNRARFSGRLLADGRVQRARIDAAIARLADLGALVGMDIRGRVDADLRLGADGIVGTAEAEGLYLAAADLLVGQLSVGALADTPSGVVATVEGLRYRGITMDSAVVEAAPSRSNREWNIKAKLHDEHGAVDVYAAMRAGNAEHGFAATLSELSGSALGHEVSLVEPVVFASSANGAANVGGRIAVGAGHLDLDWHLRTGGSFGEIRADRFPLAYIAPLVDETLWLEGIVAADIVVPDPARADAAAPSIELKVRGARAAETGLADTFPGFDLIATARERERDNDVTFDVVLTDPSAERLQLEGTVSTQASATPFGGIHDGSVIAASLTGAVGPRAIAELAALFDARLTARLTADMKITGPVGDPSMNGRLQVSQGRYEDSTTGAVLRDLAVLIASDGTERARIDVTARDEDEGRLVGRGTVDLSAGIARPSAKARLELASMHVVQLDEATARVSGVLDFDADADAARLSGTLRTDKLSVEIPKRLPVEITELAVIEDNAALLGRDARKTAEEPAGPIVDLDVVVEVPGPAFVRSKEMKTEWRGRIKLGGTSVVPAVGGGLELMRGDFKALGVRIVASEGRLRFDPSPDARHTIDLRGQIKRDAIDVTVIIAGPLSKLAVRLESQPPLPEDEIVAFILFGSSVSTLTPLQAVQLAAAVASLASPRSASDPLAWFRDSTGLDRIDILSRSAPEDQSQYMLSAGKYVREGVFVSVAQPLGLGASEVAVELEVTDHLTVKSSVGADSRGSVGAAWTLDY